MKTSSNVVCAPCRLPERAPSRLGRTALVLLFAGLLPACAWAQNPALMEDDLAGHPQLRRAELRRALSTGTDVSMTVADRRRMSPEERDALHRDLRNAMRGAYREDDDDRSREPK